MCPLQIVVQCQRRCENSGINCDTEQKKNKRETNISFEKVIMDRNGRLTTNRWLEAVWEPSARIHALPGGLDMLDVSGDGEAKLICADPGIGTTESSKIRVFKVGDKISEHAMVEPPCGLVGFHTENGEPRSAALAVGVGSSVFIYKNMRPHFKYCLPHLDAHPKEREIWHKAGLDEDLNVLTLRDDLALLFKELGAAFMSPRTLKFLAIDETLRLEFTEQYRRLPLVKTNAVTTIGSIRRDSSNEIVASSCLVVGTESGELLILDPRSFSLVERQHVGWIPVALASAGMWSGDGHVYAIGRDCNLGMAKKGAGTLRSWEKLASPGVAVSTLNTTGVAVLTMSGSLFGFSNSGAKLWRIKLPGIGLDLTSLPVPAAGLTLLAVSCPKAGGVAVYDARNYVDTISTTEPVAAMKYGRMGQEERAMAMITIGGGLCVKILKRTANFSSRQNNNYCTLNEAAQSNRFAIPKKTRLFVEQTIRERSEAKKIHDTFRQDLLRLKLDVCKKMRETVSSNTNAGSNAISVEASVLGLGPIYQIRTMITNVSDGPSNTGLFLVFRNNDLVDIEPRMVFLPLLPGGIPIPVYVRATPRSQVTGRVQILLCKKGNVKPVSATTIVLPVAEEDIEI